MARNDFKRFWLGVGPALSPCSPRLRQRGKAPQKGVIVFSKTTHTPAPSASVRYVVNDRLGEIAYYWRGAKTPFLIEANDGDWLYYKIFYRSGKQALPEKERDGYWSIRREPNQDVIYFVDEATEFGVLFPKTSRELSIPYTAIEIRQNSIRIWDCRLAQRKLDSAISRHKIPPVKWDFDWRDIASTRVAAILANAQLDLTDCV